MAVTFTSFRIQFPEFNNVDAALLTAHLNAALLEIDPVIWGAKADQGQMYLAAHKLALSPMGQSARLVSKDGVTTYLTHYKKLQLSVSSGFRVC